MTNLKSDEYLQLVNAIPDGIYVADENGAILSANPALVRILGLNRVEEAVGRLIADFAAPEFRKLVSERYAYAMKTDSAPGSFVMKLIKPDGEAAWVEVQPSTLSFRGGKSVSSGLIRDITELRQAEETLKASEALYRAIVEGSPYGVLVFGTDGKIVKATERAAILFGCPGALSLTGRGIAELAAEDATEAMELLVSSLPSGKETVAEEYRLRREDGSAFWGELSATRIGAPDGKTELSIVIAHDVSERHRLAETLKTLSATDDLTGLLNRRGFQIAAEQELRHSHRTGRGMALLFFDMDGLKSVNDSFGHAEGDSAIQEIAKIIVETFRDSDIVSRWGGDEFVVLALDIPEGCIPLLLERLDATLDKRNRAGDARYQLSVCLGISKYDPAVPSSVQELVNLADTEMYEDKKRKGRR